MSSGWAGSDSLAQRPKLDAVVPEQALDLRADDQTLVAVVRRR